MTTPNDLLLRLFVPIQKVDEEQRLVYGTVAAEVEDNAGEIFDYDGSKPYFEAWTKNAEATSNGLSKGNLRVMHGPKVAGKLTDIDFNDAQKMISCVAHVVDDDEWKKVQTGCYTGFSMGGRYMSKLKKDDGPTRYVANPVEVSLVDKPCIKTAVFDYCKADGTHEQRGFDGNLLVDHAPQLLEVLKYDEDQPRDEQGRWSGEGGGEGSSGASAEASGIDHGGADPSGHGAANATALTTDENQRAESHGKYLANSWSNRIDNDWKKLGPDHSQAHPNVKGAASRSEAYQRSASAIRDHIGNMASKGIAFDKVTETGMRIAADKLDAKAGRLGKSDEPVDPYFVTGTEEFVAEMLKVHTGEPKMYVPTNDEMLPVAKSLAKADGKPETAWLEYMEPAREQLVAKASAADGKDQTDATKDKGSEAEAAANADKSRKDGGGQADKSKVADKGAGKSDTNGPHDHAGTEQTDAKPGSSGAPNPSDPKGNTESTTTADKSGIDDKDSKTKGKFPFKKADGSPVQAWIAEDGEPFLAKADCVAHNEALAKAAAPKSELLTALSDLGQLIKADDGDSAGKPWGKHDPNNADCKCADCKDKAEKADAANTTFATLRTDLAANVAKFAVFRDNELTKGMYTVSRLASLMEALESLHTSVCWEEQAEGDGSSLPGALLEGLKSLGQTLVSMCTEEVNEMIAGGGKLVDDSPIMELAASTLGLEKADFAKEIGERVEKRDVASMPGGELLAKFDTLKSENDVLKAEMAEAVPLIKSLFAEVQAIKALPRPPAPNPRVVEKGDDAGQPGSGGKDLLAKFDPSDLANAAIRMAQQNGRHMVSTPTRG